MQTQSWIIITFIAIVLIILLLFAFIIIISVLFQEKQGALKSEYEQELLRSQLEIQEQTVSEISMEIHDNVGQLLSVARLHLTLIELEPGHRSQPTVKYIGKVLTQAAGDLSDITKSKSLELLKTSGLDQAIENQVEHLQKTGKFIVEFQKLGGDLYLSEQIEIILFRILQEALSNIIRHASASRITVILDGTQPAFISLRISDDGIGLPSETLVTSNEGHIRAGGLYHMVSRARLINGTVFIQSVPGKGTSIEVRIPQNQVYDRSES